MGVPPIVRVYYEVLERYPRDKFKFEGQVLEVIRDAIKGSDVN